jgi:hypothetical protein
MSPLRRVRPLLATAVAVLFAWPAAASAQSTTNGPYDSGSFEAHRYTLGTLPGLGFASGQDGWMLFDSLALQPNLAAATVQTAVVRSGQQAVKFDAAGLTPGCFGELRRNAMFNLTTGVIECEFEFLIASSSQPSTAWEFYTQPFPHPQSCQLRWSIAANGRIDYWTTPQHQVVQTNHFVSKDQWHHARTVVDIFGNRTEVHVDGVLVAVGVPIAVSFAAPAHGFSQWNAIGAGNDALHLDDVRIRERTAPHGLTVGLPRLPVNVRSVTPFALAGGPSLANRGYGVLASISGTSPGTPIGSVTLPLNVDGFTGLIAANFLTPALPGFLGVLNGDGNAFASFDTTIPVPAGLLGLAIDFAWLTTAPFDAASEPCRVQVTVN